MEPYKTMNFKAENKATLLDILRSIDIMGPLKDNYREKDATEPYAIAHLLSSLAAEDELLTFPLRLVHNDKPDFLLSMDGKKIGIEHTDARPKNETNKNVLRNRERIGPMVCFITPAKPGEPKRSAKELRKEIEVNASGEGWGNQDDVDKEWAQVMLWFIGEKERKLKEDFSRYNEDWLLIRDAWPFPSVNPENAAKYLFSQVMKRNVKLEFHRVFIISYSNRGPVCEVAESGYHLHPRNDLWL
jgi:hypothetical protein